MSQYLPTGGFTWMTEKQIQKVNLAACTEDRKKGMILEVDLEYPKELHELHNDYPLAAEKMKVTKEMLSPYLSSPDVEIFDCRLGRKRLRPNICFPVSSTCFNLFPASTLHVCAVRSGRVLEIMESNGNKRKLSGFHCFVFKFRSF